MTHSISEWANFQKLLFEAADNDPVSSAAEVINSSFLQTEKDVYELLSQLSKIIRSYPGKLKQYAIFIKELIDKLTPELNFREKFLKIFNENEKIMFLLYRHLFLLGFCQIEDIIAEFHTPKYDKPVRRTLLITFLPELYKYDQETVKMALNELSSEKDLFNTHVTLENFVEKVPKVEELLISGQHTNSIENAIKFDDVERLKEITQRKTFDMAAPLKSTEFELVPVHGLTPIGAAAIFGSVNCFKFLVIKQALDIPSPQPIVHLAIYGGNHEIIHILQQSNAKFDGALGAAAKSFRPSHFMWLLQTFPLNLIIKPVTANGILTELIKNCDLTSLLVFLDSELNDKLNDKLTPVFNAAKSTNLIFFQHLFEQLNTDVNSTNSSGYTLLHVVNDPSIAEYLFSLPNIDVSIVNKDGYSPLHEYASRGNIEVAKLFLEHSPSSISLKSNSGMTPLHCAASSGKGDFIRYLIAQEGIDVNAVDRDGNTPLHYAARSSSRDSVEALLSSSDINIFAENKFKEIPYFCAAKSSNSDVFSALAEYPSFDINQKDSNGLTALMYAIDRPCLSIFEYLLSRDEIDVNSTDTEFNKTPLMHLVAAPWNAQTQQMVDTLLIVHGLDINKQDKSNNTAIHIAAMLERKEIIDIISKLPDLNMNISNGILTVKEAIEGKHQRRLQKSRDQSIDTIPNSSSEEMEDSEVDIDEQEIDQTPIKSKPKQTGNKTPKSKGKTPQSGAKSPNNSANKSGTKPKGNQSPQNKQQKRPNPVSTPHKTTEPSKLAPETPTSPSSIDKSTDDQMSTRPPGQPQGGCCRI
ncbi:hypothetical protein TVAG_417660 [Trichomonas vaginalis G3]|uniref:Uncharacterized protein n=1 Tax=Trichomonas vaginalis (strain ATCC PRA-98 / G3) TaxID=412133 RepID=A2ED88_TRIV3|nr:spectrin binding [Trichomonas vaginalis G3]EAY09346.1 hypothetical protein TVAG_417660 [Trichomonas vaginalis G3]KAI5501719.1 spectrin binding [Trichomonas vaginalis G3]|eukprot:XP_001321569.1 hypothetical protein [Trichomonas vaginalis G3]